MAKGQMRSNKEVKKPKKEKVKASAAATNPLTARLVDAQEKAKNAKK